MSEIPKVVEPKLMETNYGKPEKQVEETNIHSFDDLKFNEKNEAMKAYMDLMDSYFDFKLVSNFNPKQKENIKLILISQVSKQINTLGKKSFTQKVKELIKNIPQLLKEKGKEKSNNEIKKLFIALGLPNLQTDIDKSIEKINKEKNKKQFDNLKTSFSSLGIDEKDFTSIQGEITKTNKIFIELSEKADGVKDMAESLGLGEELGGILEYFQKEFPLLGKIFAFLFGMFENNSNNGEKTKKSVSNLQTFLEKKKEKSPLDKIEKNGNFKNKEKLNPKKLENFYKYLDSKGIKYGDKNPNFWEEFVTGNIKNPKITELHNLLIHQEKNKSKISLKLVDLEQFIKILNNLGKIEEKIKNKEITEHNLKIEKQIQEAKKSGNTQKVTELEKQIKYSFEDLLKQNKIDVNGKVKEISIINEGKNIKIGENTYDISIDVFGERFEIIEGNNGVYTIYAGGKVKILSQEKIKEILQDLIIDDNVNTTIKAGGYNANLKITKKA